MAAAPALAGRGPAGSPAPPPPPSSSHPACCPARPLPHTPAVAGGSLPLMKLGSSSRIQLNRRAAISRTAHRGLHGTSRYVRCASGADSCLRGGSREGRRRRCVRVRARASVHAVGRACARACVGCRGVGVWGCGGLEDGGGGRGRRRRACARDRRAVRAPLGHGPSLEALPRDQQPWCSGSSHPAPPATPTPSTTATTAPAPVPHVTHCSK